MVAIPAASVSLTDLYEDSVAVVDVIEEGMEELSEAEDELKEALGEEQVAELKKEIFQGKSKAEVQREVANFAAGAANGQFASVPNKYKDILRKKLGPEKIMRLKERIRSMGLSKEDIIRMVGAGALWRRQYP